VVHPTSDAIARAAFDLWQRRGQTHGHDCQDWFAAEADLAFRLNYETVAEYSLRSPLPVILGDPRARKCRFCERTPGRAPFGPPFPVLPRSLGDSSLRSVELCDECEAYCRDPLNDQLAQFWRAARAEFRASEGRASRARLRCSPRAYKSLVAIALLVLPFNELDFFPGALDWMDNPAPDADARLFDTTACRAYLIDDGWERSWICLARRVDDEADLPYMLFFLAWNQMVVQLPLPLCLRDQDLDGEPLRLLEPPLGSMSEDLSSGLSRKQLAFGVSDTREVLRSAAQSNDE
jgi:hypothetical protein